MDRLSKKKKTVHLFCIQVYFNAELSGKTGEGQQSATMLRYLDFI